MGGLFFGRREAVFRSTPLQTTAKGCHKSGLLEASNQAERPGTLVYGRRLSRSRVTVIESESWGWGGGWGVGGGANECGASLLRPPVLGVGGGGGGQ